MLGSFVSILIYTLVIVQLIQKSIDLVDMNDPSILSYERPIYIDEDKNLGDNGSINLPDHMLHMGVLLKNHKGSVIEIPESIGHWVSYINVIGKQ